MAVKKVSVSLDEEAITAAKRAAEERNMSLSAWLSEAATERAAVERGLAAMDLWDAIDGPVPQEVKDHVDRVLAGLDDDLRLPSERDN